MKKLYFFYALMVSMLYSLSGFAQTTTEDIEMTVCIHVDKPGLCYLSNYEKGRIDLTETETMVTFTLHKTTYSDGSGYAYSDNWSLNVVDEYKNDYFFSDCDVEINGERSKFSRFWGATKELNISFDSEDYNGCTLYPVISSYEEVRTSKATLFIDDASKMNLRCGFAGYSPKVVDGMNTISFNPDGESYWFISASETTPFLGGVTVNGNGIMESSGGFGFYAKDGDEIVVDTKINLDPVPVSFKFSGEGAVALKNVYKHENYTEEAIPNWRNGFSVTPRSEIILEFDDDTYNVNSLTVNGVEQTVNSRVYLTISGKSEIAVNAVKYGTRDIKLLLTDPTHVSVALGVNQYSSSKVLNGLVAGEQTLTVSDKFSHLIINQQKGYILDAVMRVLMNGASEPATEGYNGYAVDLTDVQMVVVNSHEIVRNDVATLWINDMELCSGVYVNTNDNTELISPYADDPAKHPVTGEQTFKFAADIDNPISVSFYLKEYGNPSYLTVNDEVAEPSWPGGTSYSLVLKNGDVVKIFAGETPGGQGDDAKISVTINVDESNRLYYINSDYDEVDLQAGENVLKFNEEEVWQSINVRDGYGVKSFTNVATGEEIEERWGSYILQLTTADNGNVYNVVTYDENESRTAVMPIWVDDPTNVKISYANSGKQASPLKKGDNEFRYNPETETSINIYEANYGYLYQVLVNGEKVEPFYGQFNVECSPENKVEIYAVFPDVEVPVTFSFVNEGTEGAIARVAVNNAQVNNYLDGLTVKMGDELSIDMNNIDFDVTDLTLNGVPVEDYRYGWTGAVVDEKMEFVVTADKWKTIPFTLNITDPKAVVVYKGEAWDEVKFTDLVAGENKLEVSEAAPMITIKPTSGATISSVTKNGEAVEQSWYDLAYAMEIAAGDVVYVDAKAAMREQKAIVWVDDATPATWLCGMSRADDSPYDDADGILKTGANEVWFDAAADNPFSLSFAGPTIEEGSVKVFINNSEESLVPDFNNYFSGIVLADGDIVKVFIANDPATYITEINQMPKQVEGIYNLQGIKVNGNTLPAGIYIKNGKKVFVK